MRDVQRCAGVPVCDFNLVFHGIPNFYMLIDL